MEQSTLVFCYGTLKSGERNNHLMRGKLIGPAKTYEGFALIDLGTFPGLVKGDKAIEGEVWEVDEANLRLLDRFEGVYSGVYVRQQIMLEDGRRVQAYIYARPYDVEYPGVCWKSQQ